MGRILWPRDQGLRLDGQDRVDDVLLVERPLLHSHDQRRGEHLDSRRTEGCRLGTGERARFPKTVVAQPDLPATALSKSGICRARRLREWVKNYVRGFAPPTVERRQRSGGQHAKVTIPWQLT